MGACSHVESRRTRLEFGSGRRLGGRAGGQAQKWNASCAFSGLRRRRAERSKLTRRRVAAELGVLAVEGTASRARRASGNRCGRRAAHRRGGEIWQGARHRDSLRNERGPRRVRLAVALRLRSRAAGSVRAGRCAPHLGGATRHGGSERPEPPDPDRGRRDRHRSRLSSLERAEEASRPVHLTIAKSRFPVIASSSSGASAPTRRCAAPPPRLSARQKGESR
jgi:hypothetical protein